MRHRHALLLATALLALLAAVAVPGAIPGTAAADEAPPVVGSPGGGSAPANPLPPPSRKVTVPRNGPLFLEGPDRRLLLDGPWLFRPDPADAGVGERLFAQQALTGWGGTAAPSV